MLEQKKNGGILRAGSLLVLLALMFALPVSAAQPSGWAKADIQLAQAQGLVTDAVRADYQGDITRREFAELAVILYSKFVGQTPQWDAARPAPFSDVGAGEGSIQLAYQLGLVSGVSETTFAPQKPITRQEICVMLGRTMEKALASAQQSHPQRVEELSASAEGWDIPEWARDSVLKLVGMGVLGGTNAGYALGDHTSREQAAILALRLAQCVEAGKQSFTQAELERIFMLKTLEGTIGTRKANATKPYTVNPVITAPFSPGALQEDFLQDGLNMINYARTIAGLPGDVTYSAEENRIAQYGALLTKVGSFSHTPPQPKDMSAADYEMGYSATSSGNIGRGYGDLFGFNMGCLHDSDASNISRVGHRRWLLNPNLSAVGMGYVEGSTVTTVFDTRRSPAISPELVTWPAAGVFPVAQTRNKLAWSCSPDPEKYHLWDSANVTVTVTREGDGKVFHLTPDMNDSNSGNYCTVSTVSYGYGPAVIFRPEVDGYVHGAVYHIEINNVKKPDGGMAKIEYTTKFYE